MEAITFAGALGGAFGAIAGARPARSGALHRTGMPVLRGSLEAGTFEDSFWTKPAPGETDRIFKAATLYEKHYRAQRAAARRGGGNPEVITPAPLTKAAIDILEYLCMMARTCKGRLYPSYDAIMAATHRCRQSVASALHQLEEIGIIARRRRFVRLDKKGPGPRSEQTSNVYRLQLPGVIARLLPAKLRPAPVPDDHLHRIEQNQTEYFAMLKFRARAKCKLPVAADFMERNPYITSPELAEALARLERAGLNGGFTDSECESGFQTQPLLSIDFLRDDKDAP